jgi:hypothetical protein
LKQNEEQNKSMLFVVPDANISLTYHDLIQIVLKHKNESTNFNRNENIDNNINQEDNDRDNSSSSSISETLSLESSDFVVVNGVQKHISEPEDDLIYLNDRDLIKKVDYYLKLAKKYEIEEFYRKNKMKPKRFGLSGLYTSKFGIKTEKQRYLIRDLCRVCKQYINSEYVENKRNALMKNLEKQKQWIDQTNQTGN